MTAQRGEQHAGCLGLPTESHDGCRVVRPHVAAPLLGSGETVSRQAHNLETAGSTPASPTCAFGCNGGFTPRPRSSCMGRGSFFHHPGDSILGPTRARTASVSRLPRESGSRATQVRARQPRRSVSQQKQEGSWRDCNGFNPRPGAGSSVPEQADTDTICSPSDTHDAPGGVLFAAAARQRRVRGRANLCQYGEHRVGGCEMPRASKECAGCQEAHRPCGQQKVGAGWGIRPAAISPFNKEAHREVAVPIVVRDTAPPKRPPENRRTLIRPQVVAGRVIMGGTFTPRRARPSKCASFCRPKSAARGEVLFARGEKTMMLMCKCYNSSADALYGKGRRPHIPLLRTDARPNQVYMCACCTWTRTKQQGLKSGDKTRPA